MLCGEKRFLCFFAAALFLLVLSPGLTRAEPTDHPPSQDETEASSKKNSLPLSDPHPQIPQETAPSSPVEPIFDFDDEIFFDSAPSDLLPLDFSTANEEGSPLFATTSVDEFQAKTSFLQASFCRRFKQDERWKRQFLYMFLYSLYWPLYTRKKFWDPPLTSYFFKLVLTKTISLNELDKSNSRVSRFLKRAKKCGFQAVIQEELPNRTDISDYETFMEILKREKADDPHFAQMVSIVPELKMSLDDGPTVVGYIVQQVSDIQVMYSYANTFTIADMHTWARVQFRQYQRSMATALELLHINSVQALLADLHTRKQDDPMLELELERFEAKLKSAVVDSVRLLLVRMSMLVESNWLGSRNALMEKFPDVVVTAYRARGPSGPQAVVERGDFGSEINEHILASLINDLKANELYVQLSVADPITHPLLEAVTPHIPALKAARMFKRSLEDDPSLPGVGLAAVAYSTFNDLQYGEPVGATQNAPYDPDLHLLIHVPQEQFRGSSQFHALFMAAITVQPLAYTEPKHVGPERVQVMGFARKIPGSRPMRMGKFGNGLPYSEQILIDQLIAKHNFIVHVLITGLRRETERREAEATAEEIYKRFKIRTRGTFDVVFIEPVKPQEASPAGEVRETLEGYPAWVLGVAVGSTALFFVVLIACLVARSRLRLPWWMSCFCSPHAPFSKEAAAGEAGRRDAERNEFANSIVEGTFPGERVSLSRTNSFRASDETAVCSPPCALYSKGAAATGHPAGQSMRSLATYNSANYPTKNRVLSGLHEVAMQGSTVSAWDISPLASLEGAHSRRLETLRKNPNPQQQLPVPHNRLPEELFENKTSGFRAAGQSGKVRDRPDTSDTG